VTLPRPPRHLSRSAAGIAAVVGLGIGLTACADNGQNLARQACVHVNDSISLLKLAGHEPDPQRAGALEQQAVRQLRTALPIAAEAAYDDAQWQALMTTISESNRVPPTTLVSALTQQCAQAESGPFNQAPPSSIPPPAPFTSST
jgi:hypothetical protein